MIDATPCILAINAAEGFLQFTIGTIPAKNGNNPAQDAGKRKQHGEDGLMCAQEWRLPSQGAELLVPVLRDSLDKLGMTARQISRIACVTGPGSFTGIRLAIGTAAGLSQTTGAVMAGMSYMSLLADNAVSILGSLLPVESLVWVVTHARRNLVHAQCFSFQPQKTAGCVSQSDIIVVELEELVSLTARAERPVVLLGSGITRNKAFLLENYARLEGRQPTVLGENFDTPAAATLFRTSCMLEYGLEELEPCYVRPSDAEESLEQIAAKLGLDAQEVLSAYTTFQQT